MLSRAILVLSLMVTLHAAAAPETYLFKRIVIADSEAAALAVKVDPASPASVYVDKVSLFEGSDFEQAIAPLLGKPITPDVVNRLSALLTQFARTHDRLLANVQIPNQNVADGTLRFAVVIGRFNELSVRGNRWFSSQLLQEKLGIKPGDEVRLSVLEAAVNWANTNPFRRVKVIVNPIETQPGEANLLIGVQDIRPWRFAASADNYGNEILGQWHYTGSVQAGNLWGRDHRGSYQFVTTDNVHVYQAHVVDYNVPLPWRHFIEATASYVRLNPVFGVNNVLAQAARSEALDLKYTIPVRNGDDPIEVHTGIDFSRSNNNLEYAGTRVYGSDVDTFQWTSGGSIVKHDKHGGWLFAASVSLSPGGIDGRNSSTAFQNARFGSTPRYVYGTVSVQRALSLGHGWDLSSRLLGQVASTNLVNGQLAIGGPTSVRGFKTNVSAGDQGFVFNNDLLTPTITTSLEKFGKKLPPLETRFAAFYDAGNVNYKFRYSFDPHNRPLAGAGVGLRMSVSNSFTLSFDYGWQITRQPYQTNEHSYGHFKVGLAF
jgi:hemolysin activation/secretion protein